MYRRQLVKAGLASIAAPITHTTGQSPPILTISGSIGRYTDRKRKVYEFTESELIGLPARSITTSTLWTPTSAFSGPLLIDVLMKAETQGTMLTLKALDEYSTRIPVSDLRQYGVILAHTRNGARMRVDRFGPLWVVYPRDRYSELQSVATDEKFIWQVRWIHAAIA